MMCIVGNPLNDAGLRRSTVAMRSPQLTARSDLALSIDRSTRTLSLMASERDPVPQPNSKSETIRLLQVLTDSSTCSVHCCIPWFRPLACPVAGRRWAGRAIASQPSERALDRVVAGVHVPFGHRDLGVPGDARQRPHVAPGLTESGQERVTAVNRARTASPQTRQSPACASCDSRGFDVLALRARAKHPACGGLTGLTPARFQGRWHSRCHRQPGPCGLGFAEQDEQRAVVLLSRRRDSISRSPYGFCQGLDVAETTKIPMPASPQRH
jgi:hypothetical protein